MSDKFSKVPIATANRSKHNLSAPHVTSTDFGRMDVIYHTQLIPGDDISVNIHSFLRAAPMPQTTFGKCYLNVRAFFCPNRILHNDRFYWDNWRSGLTTSSHPYFTEKDLVNLAFKVGSTDPILSANYRKDWRRHLSQLGFPDRMYNYGSNGGDFSQYNKAWNPYALLTYQSIWWYWYRDSNLIDDSQRYNYVPLLGTGNQSSIVNYLKPRYCCYQKDIFTTAFVKPQAGNSTASIGTAIAADNPSLVNPSNPNNVLNLQNESVGITWSNSNIQFLRAANSLQRYLERNNIAGGRVMARFLARFGIAPDHVRLDQPEYCGGFSVPLSLGDVTSPIDVTIAPNPNNAFTQQGASTAGQLAGKGYFNGGSSDIKYHAREDGTFMIISTVVPEVFYFEGVNPDLMRGVDNVKESYFTPEFEGLGYEPLKRIQVAATRLDADPTGSYDDEIFGFVPRYSTYKYKLGTVSGDNVLSETKTGMQGFHLGRSLLTNGINQAALLPEFTMITPQDRHALDRIFTFIGTYPGDFDHFEGVHLIDAPIVRPMTGSKMPDLEEDSHSSGKVVTIDNGGSRM